MSPPPKKDVAEIDFPSTDSSSVDGVSQEASEKRKQDSDRVEDDSELEIDAVDCEADWQAEREKRNAIRIQLIRKRRR